VTNIEPGNPGKEGKMPPETDITYSVRCDEPDRYLVEDMVVSGARISKTTLYPGRSTRGHCHTHPELYYFLSGQGTIVIGTDRSAASPGATAFIPGDSFHQVVNGSGRNLVFLCIW